MINEKQENTKTNILTFTGVEMDPLRPNPEDLQIRDIAHALSMLARANGHFHSFHSVAQHSMECALEAEARGLDTDLILFCLLHDGAEAYLGDFVSPVKHQMKDYNQAEHQLLSMIYNRFAGRCPDTEEMEMVKEIDHTLLYYEFLALMGKPIGQKPEKELVSEPDFSEKNWSWVEEAFLALYESFRKRQRLEKIEEIWFDVDDTLYSQQESFGDACQKTFGDCYGISIPDLLDAYYDTYNSGGGVQLVHGAGGYSPELLQQMRITEAFRKFSRTITSDQAIQFQECYLHNQENRHLSPLLTQMFDCCAGRIGMGIISNGDSAYQRKKIRALGLARWFAADRILISGEVGADKPDRRIFDVACQRAGLDTDRLLYVGDSLNNDIRGAGNAGWMTVWMNRRGKKRSERDPVPDYEVQTEEELFQLLISIIER